MSIDFSIERWRELTETYRRWWSGELDRPIIAWTLAGRDPQRREPDIPAHGFTAFHDLSVSPEAIVDRWDYDLSRRTYLGDAFPSVWPNFGPGVIAAFMGADLQLGEGTVWFHPQAETDLANIHFEYDADNVWLKRIKDICRAAADRWEGLVQVGMTDLGGNLDILSTFRPAERLLLDLYDCPGEVQRVLWEAHEMWHRYFAEIDAVVRATNPGYSAWASIFSYEPHYILQCDFCYMISLEMFDRFVKPELVTTCGMLTNTFYHLDGVGQLAHLDSLLEIDALGGVQWVPGTGKPQGLHWADVYRKIARSGKKMQLMNDEALDLLVDEGHGPQVIWLTASDADGEAHARETLAKYGVG